MVAKINGVEQTVTLSSADPLWGTYQDQVGMDCYIYYMSDSLWDVLNNKKYFYDEYYKKIKLEL